MSILVSEERLRRLLKDIFSSKFCYDDDVKKAIDNIVEECKKVVDKPDTS